jgi:hypothetical protein
MPPDSKDTGEKPWPEVVIADVVGAEKRGFKDRAERLVLLNAGSTPDVPFERYLPLQVIRERLTSGEALKEAAERLDPGNAEIHYYGGTYVEDRARELAEVVVIAALDAAFSKEEGSGG